MAQGGEALEEPDALVLGTLVLGTLVRAFAIAGIHLVDALGARVAAPPGSHLSVEFWAQIGRASCRERV